VGTFTDDEGVVQEKTNKWNQVYDFTSKKAGGLNFTLVEPSSFKIVDASSVVPADVIMEPTAHMDFLFELPVEFGGSLVQTEKPKDSMMTFDITTGAQAAEEIFK